jgi:hypothetical protein
MSTFRGLIFLLFLTVSGIAACAASPYSPFEKDQPFLDWTMRMTDQIKANPKYNRIPLDTDEKSVEFVGWLHDMYRNKITPEQFEQLIDQHYPGHKSEAEFIVGTLPPSSARPPEP